MKDHFTFNDLRDFGCSCGKRGPIGYLPDHLRETGQHVECHGKGCRSCDWTGTPPDPANRPKEEPSIEERTAKIEAAANRADALIAALANHGFSALKSWPDADGNPRLMLSMDDVDKLLAEIEHDNV